MMKKQVTGNMAFAGSGPMDLPDQPLNPWVAQADLPQMGIAARSEIRHPRLLRLYDYWMERRGTRRYPARADLDPLDMGYILGELIVLDVHYEPLRFKYRLHGTKLVTRAGLDMTGKWVHDWPAPEYRARLICAYTRTIEAGEPQRGERAIFDDGRWREYEFLILPLAPDRHLIDKLLVAMVYLDRFARLVDPTIRMEMRPSIIATTG
jgi:hypothetical protein